MEEGRGRGGGLKWAALKKTHCSSCWSNYGGWVVGGCIYVLELSRIVAVKEGTIWYSGCPGKVPMARRVQELYTRVVTLYSEAKLCVYLESKM